MDIDRIVFLDLETTGFDERKGCILESGIIVCDLDLNELGRDSTVIESTAVGQYYFDPTAEKMHAASGLLAESNGSLYGTADAEDYAMTLMAKTGCKPKQTMIAGNSIGFDVRWLREHMPRLHDFFVYRVLDISSFHAAATFWAVPPPKPTPAHRALADCENSLAGARFYRDLFRSHAKRTEASEQNANLTFPPPGQLGFPDAHQ